MSHTRDGKRLAVPVVQHYGVLVDFVVCPADGVRLKADLQAHTNREPLVLRCPTCDAAYTMDDRGLRRLPDNPPRS